MVKKGETFYIVKDGETGAYYLFDEDCSIARTREGAERFIKCVLTPSFADDAEIVKAKLVEIEEVEK